MCCAISFFFIVNWIEIKWSTKLLSCNIFCCPYSLYKYNVSKVMPAIYNSCDIWIFQSLLSLVIDYFVECRKKKTTNIIIRISLKTCNLFAVCCIMRSCHMQVKKMRFFVCLNKSCITSALKELYAVRSAKKGDYLKIFPE